MHDRVLALCMAARVLEHPGPKIRRSRRFLSHRRPSSRRFSPLPKTLFRKRFFCRFTTVVTVVNRRRSPPRPRCLRPPSNVYGRGRFRSPLLRFASGFARWPPPRFTQPSRSRRTRAARPVSPFRTLFTSRLFERLDGLSGIGETGLLLADSQARGGSRRWAPIRFPVALSLLGTPPSGAQRYYDN